MIGQIVFSAASLLIAWAAWRTHQINRIQQQINASVQDTLTTMGARITDARAIVDQINAKISAHLVERSRLAVSVEFVGADDPRVRKIDHPFEASDNPAFGMAWGGACAHTDGETVCGWPRGAHPHSPEFDEALERLHRDLDALEGDPGDRKNHEPGS